MAKRIVFDDDAFQIMELPDIDQERRCWYSPHELNNIPASLINEESCQDHLSNSMYVISNFPPSQFHLSQSRIQAQKNFVSGVLAHQEDHQVQGIEDPRGLFPFSKSLSRTSQKRVVKDTEYLALECEKEINHAKQLVDYIDHALAILDLPLPLPLPDDC